MEQLDVTVESQLPKVIGLTGGIGSGKSTVSGRLRKLGCGVIDADLLAREIVAPKSQGLSTIVETFSSEILTPEGSLDRRRLRELVFRDAGARQRLNEITHPLIHEAMRGHAAMLGDAGYRWVVYDAALLVETSMYQKLAALIVVTVPRDVQRARVMARDETTLDEAERIIASQMPLEEKVAVADYVIDNSGTFSETFCQVDKLFEELERRFGRRRR